MIKRMLVKDCRKYLKVFELLSSVSKEILHIQNINTATWDNRYVENFAAKAQSDLADAVRLISEDKNETM